MEKLYIHSVNETFIQLDSENYGIIQDLHEYFTFEVPNAKFSKAYELGFWNGTIQLLGISNQIYKGLLPYIENYAITKGWEIEKVPELFEKNNYSGLSTFIKKLNLTLEPYDFQLSGIQHCIDNNRATIISPTSSGKSLIFYVLTRFYLENTPKKILIIEPTVKLVNQILTEFKQYSAFPIEDHVHKIYAGESHQTSKRIIISTWQSLMKEKKEYFGQFDAIIVDECHKNSAQELKSILEKCTETKYRFGLTGTLQETECHRLVIEGLLGPALQVAEQKELMDRGITSKLVISGMILNYSDQIKDQMKEDYRQDPSQNKKRHSAAKKYQDEVDFVVHCPQRNQFIANLCAALKPGENTLILTEYHEKKKHCDILKEAIQKTCPNKTILIVNGKSKEDTELVRKFIEENNNVILIATFGVFSTGMSIKNLQNLIFSTFSKSIIKVLQSIGRLLRLDGKTNSVTAYDIVDDLSTKTMKQNYLSRHFIERVKIYINENFDYTINNITIK